MSGVSNRTGCSTSVNRKQALSSCLSFGKRSLKAMSNGLKKRPCCSGAQVGSKKHKSIIPKEGFIVGREINLCFGDRHVYFSKKSYNAGFLLEKGPLRHVIDYDQKELETLSLSQQHLNTQEFFGTGNVMALNQEGDGLFSLDYSLDFFINRWIGSGSSF
tara:strand:+ start:109 stop:588 length:480 start_codon:yes stop_codon:yes gene_type:complete